MDSATLVDEFGEVNQMLETLISKGKMDYGGTSD